MCSACAQFGANLSLKLLNLSCLSLYMESIVVYLRSPFMIHNFIYLFIYCLIGTSGSFGLLSNLSMLVDYSEFELSSILKLVYIISVLIGTDVVEISCYDWCNCWWNFRCNWYFSTVALPKPLHK